MTRSAIRSINAGATQLLSDLPYTIVGAFGVINTHDHVGFDSETVIVDLNTGRWNGFDFIYKKAIELIHCNSPEQDQELREAINGFGKN